MISPVSISFSEEMNTSDILESWLEGLGQHTTSEEPRSKIISDARSNGRPSHHYRTPTSSPTLPSISCPPSPLTKSEISDTPSIDIDEELRVDRQFYYALGARGGNSCAKDTLHDSQLPLASQHASQAASLLSNHLVHTTSKPQPSYVEACSTLPSRSSTSIQCQDSIIASGSGSPCNPLRAHNVRSPKHDNDLASQRSKSKILPSHMVLIRSRGKKGDSLPFGVTIGTEIFTEGGGNGVQERNQSSSEVGVLGRPDHDQETNFVAKSIRNELTVTPVSKSSHERHESPLSAAPYLSQASYSRPTRATDSKKTSNGPRRAPISSVISVKDEGWPNMLHGIPGSPTPPPKDEDINGNFYTLTLRCKSSATQSNMLQDCGMLVTEHSPSSVHRSPFRKFHKLKIQDSSSHSSHSHSESRHENTAQRDCSTVEPSLISDAPKMTIQNGSVQHYKNIAPPPLEPSHKPPLATASPPETGKSNRKRKVPHNFEPTVDKVEHRLLPELPLDTNLDHNMEQYKANSKAIRRSTLAPLHMPHVSTQHRKDFQSDLAIRNAVKYQYSPHNSTKPQASSLRSADCHYSQQSTADRFIHPLGTVGNQHAPVHIINPRDAPRSTAVNYASPRHKVNDEVSPNSDIYHHHSAEPSVSRHHHSSNHSVTLHPSSHTSISEPISCFDVRLKALERQNELLSATLMAVLDTKSTMRTSPHVENAPPVRPPQWADRVARRAAASGQAAPLPKEFSGLGISYEHVA
nr:hypothetical protein CFP56_07447 [Quercus suber]